MPHRQRGFAVEQVCGTGEQELQVIVQLGHRADRGTRRPDRIGLVDRDCGRHAIDPVHRRLVHPVEELARICRECLDVATLAFGIQRVEHQARLAGTAGAGDHRQFAGAQVEVEVFEVVLPGAADADQSLGHPGALFLE